MSFSKRVPSPNERNFNSGHTHLTKESTLDDAMLVFSNIKVELACQINSLTSLKKAVTSADSVEPAIRTKLRINIESLLIDLNEEIYEISEELAKSFTPERQEAYVMKAREFEFRKKKLIKRINTQIDSNSVVNNIRRKNDHSRSPIPRHSDYI
jgi:hypothetical protein